MNRLDPKALRRAFGSYMTGITVVTARDGAGNSVGFTANSFTSVSLGPPLLLVCPGKTLSSYDAFTTCRHFAVNVLAEGQEDVSNTFAGFKGDRFGKVSHRLDAENVPLIDGAVAQFSCKTHKVVPAGDHCLLIGEIQDFQHNEGAGLGYVDGRYFSLGLERAAAGGSAKDVICGAIVESAGQVLLEETNAGFRPPQVISVERGQLRESLQEDLARRGVATRLGATYSVFDDDRTQHTYILASVVGPASHALLKSVSIKDLPKLRFCSPAIATMMTRFARESETGDFSFYLGDAVRGDVHLLTERT